MEELEPFPLLAIVGQPELKTALLLSLINPRIGGVLLIGPYGVGKTTAVRSLQDILPTVTIEDYTDDGSVQPHEHQMRLIELPLNAQIDDVVGGVNQRVALEQQRVLLEEGVLAKAHHNLLYIDEVNLLDAHVVDAILDAAAQGRTLVRRGAMVRLFPSQFVLIGSMNPEEGTLRPQILDRFGLRVWVAPLPDAALRLEVYRRATRFQHERQLFRSAYRQQTDDLRAEVHAAREILPHVTVPGAVEQLALALIQQLQIPSHRAEIALLEAARARAAADFRTSVTVEDVQRMAVPALRQRRSPVIDAYQSQLAAEDALVQQHLSDLLPARTGGEAAPPKPRRSGVRLLEEATPSAATPGAAKPREEPPA